MKRLTHNAYSWFCRCSRPSLQGVLIIPFVIQTVLAVGITGYLSFRNGQRAIDNLAHELQSEINDRVQQKLSSYLAIPHMVNRSNVAVVKLGLLDVSNLDILEDYIFQKQQQFSELTFVAFALRNGDYVGIGQRTNSSLTLGVINRALGPETQLWQLNSRGDRILQQEPITNFNPQERDWYRVAMGAGDSFWAKPFFAFDTNELLISAVDRLYDARGNFVGVVNATLSLREVSEFLANIEVGKTGQAFIIDRQGLLIATEDTDLISPDTQERLMATRSGDIQIRTVAQHLEERVGSLSRIQSTQQFTLRVDREVLSVQVHPFRDGRGLDWIVVIVIPRSDFTAEIVASTRWTIALCLVALGVAIFTGIRTSRWIAGPISRLGAAATALAQGDWQQAVDTQRNDELGTLARAFDEMRSQLKQAQLGLEQKIAERTQELRESEEKFSKAFRLSPEPLAIASYRSEAILDVNDSFLSFSGYTRDEVIGKTGEELHLWANRDDLTEAVSRIEADGMVRNLEIRYRTKSGEIRTVLFSAEVIELNREPCVLCVLSDITELKQVAIVLQEAKTAAEAANRAKSMFLASMSHELRTPLNAILGFTQLMQRNAAYASASSELSIINRSGEHLLALINDILDMSKIEAGQTTVDITPFDLYLLLDTLEAMFRLRASAKGLLLTFARSPATPQYVYGDEKKLRQVLINLVGNAIKFTQAGSVTLRVTPLDSAEPQNLPQDAPLRSDVAHVEFSVLDTGPGIAEDELDRLFEPFVQTAAGRLSKQGTGLGLTISRKFVQLMGGDITVTTQMGAGSEFRFTLQLWQAIASDIVQPEPERRVVGLAPNQPHYRILIVDEVPENRLLLRQMLTPVGFSLFEASNGREAIAQWQLHRPHLIWMDMRMPVMDGYEATRRIKAAPEGKKTVIIALTASALDQDRENILSVGCDDFIRKPFRESAIWDAIAHHLGVELIYRLDTHEERSPLPVFDPQELHRLILESLNTMPSDWIHHLHQATLSGDDAAALALIQHLPPDHYTLAIALTQLIQDVRLDIISDITQAILDAPPLCSDWQPHKQEEYDKGGN